MRTRNFVWEERKVVVRQTCEEEETQSLDCRKRDDQIVSDRKSEDLKDREKETTPLLLLDEF
jgi:hypothetical protein